MPSRHPERGLGKQAIREASLCNFLLDQVPPPQPPLQLIARRIVMLISIIHRVNRAQRLNLDPLSSLGADKDAGGWQREVLGWGSQWGCRIVEGRREPHPIFGLTGVFKLQWKACGSWQGGL